MNTSKLLQSARFCCKGHLHTPLFVNSKWGFKSIRSYSAKRLANALIAATTQSQKNIVPLLIKDAGSKVPAKVDNSASVYLDMPPPSSEEDKEAAAYLGVNHFYRGGNLNFYMMHFHPNTENLSLEEHLQQVKLEFFSKIPYGTTSEVQLSESLLNQLNELAENTHIEFKTLFLDKKKHPADLQRVAELLFILKTPGGFWNISWHSTYLHLASNKDLFSQVLKNLRVELRKPAKKPVLTLTRSDPFAALPGKSTSKSLSKKKGLKKRPSSITKEAPLGIVHIAPEAESDDLSDVTSIEDLD